MPSASLWAAVPHYISAVAQPEGGARAALAAGACCSTRASTPRSSPRRPSRSSARSRSAVSADEKISRYVRELESRADERAEDDADEESPPLLASGDDIAAQIERYLAEREESNEDS